jgi:hypothetical protein
MRLLGFFLQIAGWIIVLAAIVLLQAAAQASFALAGFGVELLGVTLAVRSHLIPHGEKE